MDKHQDESTHTAMQHHPQNIMLQVKHACQRMIDLLQEENEYLEEKQIEHIEDIAKQKDILAQDIANLLSQIRAWASQASDSQKMALKNETISVNAHLGQINKLAQRNTTLLEANHTATRTFLDVVRDILHKPKPSTYGKKGALEEDKESRSLLTKSV